MANNHPTQWGVLARLIGPVNMSQSTISGFDDAERKLKDVVDFLKSIEGHDEDAGQYNELTRSVIELRKNLQQGIALFQDPKAAPIQVTDIVYVDSEDIKGSYVDKNQVVITNGEVMGLVTPQGVGETYHDSGVGMDRVIDLDKKGTAMMDNVRMIRQARSSSKKMEILRRSNRDTKHVHAMQVTVTWLEVEDFPIWHQEDARDSDNIFGSRV